MQCNGVDLHCPAAQRAPPVCSAVSAMELLQKNLQNLIGICRIERVPIRWSDTERRYDEEVVVEEEGLFKAIT